MSAKIKYTNEPIGKVQVVPDFLPSPAELAFREEGVKAVVDTEAEHLADHVQIAGQAVHQVTGFVAVVKRLIQRGQVIKNRFANVVHDLEARDDIELALKVTDAVGDQGKEHDQYGGPEDAAGGGTSGLKFIDHIANDHRWAKR